MSIKYFTGKIKVNDGYAKNKHNSVSLTQLSSVPKDLTKCIKNIKNFSPYI